MKKQIKTTAAIALALSAVTPVAAFAAEANVPAGLYTSSSFTQLPTFAAKTVKEKIAALADPTAVLVLSNGISLTGSPFSNTRAKAIVPLACVAIDAG